MVAGQLDQARLGQKLVFAVARRENGALNCVEFFRNESCGKCVPCRLGSQQLVGIIGDMKAGTRRQEQLDLIRDLAETMQLTSICGLGQVAANPITSVIKYFPEELTRTAAAAPAPDRPPQ